MQSQEPYQSKQSEMFNASKIRSPHNCAPTSWAPIDQEVDPWERAIYHIKSSPRYLKSQGHSVVHAYADERALNSLCITLQDKQAVSPTLNTN